VPVGNGRLGAVVALRHFGGGRPRPNGRSLDTK
jgi:hypothetical protein